MPLSFKEYTSYVIKSRLEKPNSFPVLIRNVYVGSICKESDAEQVNLTISQAGEVKRSHLHSKRRGFFKCVRHQLKIVAKTDETYEKYFSAEHHDFAST